MMKKYFAALAITLLVGCSSSDDEGSSDPEAGGPGGNEETTTPPMEMEDDNPGPGAEVETVAPTTGDDNPNPGGDVVVTTPTTVDDNPNPDEDMETATPTPNNPENNPPNARNTSLLGAIELTSTPERVGFLSFNDDSDDTEVSAKGSFVNWPANNGTDLLPLFGLTEDRVADTCEVIVLTDDDNTTGMDNFEAISAGESITFTSELGTYGSMEQFSPLLELLDPQNENGPILNILDPQNENVLYFNPGLTFPSPEALTISIPGDVFPASTVALAAKPEPIEGFSPSGIEPIQESETLSWTASSNNDTLLNVTFVDSSFLFAEDADVENVQDEDIQVLVDCLLVDDGEFVLPTTLQADAAAITGESPVFLLTTVNRILLGLSNDGLSSDAVIYSRIVNLTR